MRLFIQIPCFNEHAQLARTFAELPRSLPGITQIAVVVIDDGSTDETGVLAKQLGAHYLITFPARRGLAAAYTAGIDACLRAGADVIVNTDGDGQYLGSEIGALLGPLFAGSADIVVGDRQTAFVPHFSLGKRWLQRVGSFVVRRAAGVSVNDATSGFRALHRRAALAMFVHNRFSHTLETLIQAGDMGLSVQNVAVRSCAPTRKSRLFRSMREYVRRSAGVILRARNMYRPVQTFAGIACVLFALGLGLGGRFLYYFWQDPDYSGHVQSLLIGVGAVVLGVVVGVMALLADLMAANRRITEEVLLRVRRLELSHSPESLRDAPYCIERTSAPFWGATSP